MRALKISSTGIITALELLDEGGALLGQMQLEVGGLIQAIALSSDLELVVDEESKCGGAGTPNPLATLMLHDYLPATIGLDEIMGDALVTGIDGADVPAYALEYLLAAGALASKRRITR